MKTFWQIIKVSFWTACAALLVLLGVIFGFEHRLPQILRMRLSDALSTPDILFCVEDVRISFPRRLVLKNVRFLDKKKATAAPILSAEKVEASFSFGRLPWSAKRFLKSVELTGLKYPRLPDGYYIPDSVEFPGSPDYKEKDAPVVFDFPELEPFSVTLIRPDILAVTPARVTLPKVVFSRRRVTVPHIDLEWPDTDVTMSLTGDLLVDLEAQCVRGGVRGQARQANIRPMLAALEVSNSFPYIDGWTGVTVPVDAGCRFDVNLRNNDLHIFLDLHPTGGAYNNVHMKNANGTVDIRVFVRETFQNARIVVGPIVAETQDARPIEGSLVYENMNDRGFVHFDVASFASLSNILAVADVLNDGTLDVLQCETPPHVTLRGILAVDPKNAATNNLSGTLAFDRGRLFSVPLVNASATYGVKGTDVFFSNARATAAHGGLITGSALLSIPDFKQERATFAVDLEGRHLALEDVADMFAFDVGDRHGTLSGKLSLSGPMHTNFLERLSGSGHLTCSHGHLAQLNLFSGLTDLLADKVPGIAALVTQSSASLDFTISNGVFRTENLLIEGSVFSIRGKGQYSLVEDRLDFDIDVQLFRDKSFIGKLAQPIMWPFSKLLMAFRLFGTLEKPDWEYVTLLDRLR